MKREPFDEAQSKKYAEEFALRLSVLRNKKGVSAREMSVALDCNFGYINSIENSKSYPSMDVFFDMCSFLGVSPAEFFESFSDGSADKRSELHSLIALLSDSQVDALYTIITDLTK